MQWIAAWIRPAFLLVLAATCFTCGTGCRRRTSPTVPPPVPPASATSAPVTSSTLLWDGVPVEFPPARIRVADAVDGASVLLRSTVWPRVRKSATRPAATTVSASDSDGQNGFSLDMQLDVSAADIDGAQWEFKAPNRDRLDDPVGIFLDGTVEQLQPYDVRVTFAIKGNELTATIDGDFLHFLASSDDAQPKLVHVTGTLSAPMEMETP